MRKHFVTASFAAPKRTLSYFYESKPLLLGRNDERKRAEDLLRHDRIVRREADFDADDVEAVVRHTHGDVAVRIRVRFRREVAEHVSDDGRIRIRLTVLVDAQAQRVATAKRQRIDCGNDLDRHIVEPARLHSRVPVMHIQRSRNRASE